MLSFKRVQGSKEYVEIETAAFSCVGFQMAVRRGVQQRMMTSLGWHTENTGVRGVGQLDSGAVRLQPV